MQYKKVLALYERLSMEDADLRTTKKVESNSISNQRKLLQDYYDTHTELQEYEIVEYCDDGYTGTNFDRPQFMIMMEKVRAREIHAIIVKDLSRFGRDYLEVGTYLELILPLFGTRFISVNDNFDSNNYIGTTGGIELALRNLINGMYSRDLSVKIRSANKTRSRRGDYWGGFAFYGYLLNPRDKHKLIVDQEVVPIILRIFQECIDGLSASQSAKGLNTDGIPSPVEHKRAIGGKYNGRVMENQSIWTASAIIRILKDERYTGKMVSNKRETIGISTNKMRALPSDEWIVVNDTHEAIISQEMFELAAAARKGRIKTVNKNTAGNRADNLFVCGHCGRRLQKSHGKITHLFCTKAGVVEESPCARIHEPIEELEYKVLTLIKMFAKAFVEKAVQVKAATSQEIPQAEKRIAEIKRTIQRIENGKVDLYEEYRSGKITKSKFIVVQDENKQEVLSLHMEMAELEKKLTALRQNHGQLKTMETDAQEICMLDEYRPEVIRKFIKVVRVIENGQIEVDLLFNDETITSLLPSMAMLAG